MEITQDISNAMDAAVAPLDKSYCYYFYILAIISIVIFAILIMTTVYVGITKKMKFSFYAIAFIYSSQLLLIYLQNRLLYNMCSR